MYVSSTVAYAGIRRGRIIFLSMLKILCVFGRMVFALSTHYTVGIPQQLDTDVHSAVTANMSTAL